MFLHLSNKPIKRMKIFMLMLLIVFVDTMVFGVETGLYFIYYVSRMHLTINY